jgi:RNA polymerase sigma-70 factor (ECF subfamily)
MTPSTAENAAVRARAAAPGEAERRAAALVPGASAHPDEPALAAAQAGDERAFRTLVEPYRRTLELHCYRMLGSLDDAEDVAQETLLRAWRSLDRFERRSALTTWLYRIATNACLDELERRPRRPEPVVDPYPDDRLAEILQPIADPAARYAVREGIELAFLTAIQRLPGRQRAVLILRDVLGWTGVEVAELLESTVAATNSALQRARAAIDQELPARSLADGGPSQRALLRRYVDAWERADMEALVALLRDDAVLSMPPQPAVLGAAAIGAFFARHGCAHGRLAATAASANGRPAVVLSEPGPDGSPRPCRVLVLDVRDDRVVAIEAHNAPAVLAAFAV